MKKRILFAVLGLVIVIAALAAVKALQIRAMIDQGKKAFQPPETVTTAAARAESWETSLSAVGSLTSAQGVTVAAEMSAQVKLTQSVLARDVEMLKEKIISQAEYDAAVAGNRQAMGQVDTLRATIAKKSIRAPFGGRLGIRQANLGQILREGDPIVTLQSLDPIYVNFALPQQQLAELRPGLPVRVTCDAVPGVTIGGRITVVNPLVDAETRNIQVQATVANPTEKLLPGMFVNASVGLPARQKVLTIPATAVLYAPYGDSVFVVADDKEGKGGKALRQQFVRLGEKRGDFVAVASGLTQGESVVSTGVFKLRNGQAAVVDNRLAPTFRDRPRPENN
jgi:membrane fusion protein (multidrug efflux system)